MLLLERWTEPLAESNCYLLGEAGRAVVIDPNDPRGPLERLEALGWTPERILLTHEHCDHMAGLEALRNRWPGVWVAATAACSAGLGDTRLNMTRRMEVYLAFRGKPGVSYPPFVCRPADETYEHAWECVWRGHRLRAVALPGHTPGSAGIFLDGDIFFSGDYLIPGRRSSSACPAGARRTTAPSRSPFSGGCPPACASAPATGSPIFSKERSEAGVELNTLLQYKPYSTARTEKRALYAGLLTELTQFHREHCPEYGRLLDALGCPAHMECTVESAPMLPVSLFKELELRSIPEGEVFKTITSSGTTGQRVSRIFLDGATSACQQQALCQIMSDFLGERRLPFLVLDSRQVLRNRAMFSARGAGILGFSIFGTRPCYALDEHMELDLDGVRAFLEEHQGETIFLFGFTFIIWKHVVRALEERGERLDIPNGILVHGGGWKKLAGEAVSPGEFKARVAAATGVERVSNYYGMAEQTGCIYMECPQGHLHASLWSDIVVRRGRDYRPCEPGEEGVLQVLSPLPRSYPGHSLLTEDLGVLLGEDDCPCGRKGKYFKVTGRVPRAEVRGCSDTYEG